MAHTPELPVESTPWVPQGPRGPPRPLAIGCSWFLRALELANLRLKHVRVAAHTGSEAANLRPASKVDAQGLGDRMPNACACGGRPGSTKLTLVELRPACAVVKSPPCSVASLIPPTCTSAQAPPAHELQRTTRWQQKRPQPNCLGATQPCTYAPACGRACAATRRSPSPLQRPSSIIARFGTSFAKMNSDVCFFTWMRFSPKKSPT